MTHHGMKTTIATYETELSACFLGYTVELKFSNHLIIYNIHFLYEVVDVCLLYCQCVAALGNLGLYHKDYNIMW